MCSTVLAASDVDASRSSEPCNAWAAQRMHVLRAPVDCLDSRLWGLPGAVMTGLFAGNHGEAGPKAHRAIKAAAGGKPANRRAGAGLSARTPSAAAGLHATKQGRCQKEKRTAKRTLPGVMVADRAEAGTAAAHHGAHVT